MTRNQIELLVLYQDVDLMLQEAAGEEKTMGFGTEGKEQLEKARADIAKNIENRFLRTYQRLHTKFKRPIVPVQNDVCLGCFAKLPTSYGEKGRRDQGIYTCEQCGRILYWVDQGRSVEEDSGNAGVGTARIPFCDFRCPQAEFPRDEGVDGSGSCRTFAAVWCRELGQYTAKNAPCAVTFGKRRPKSRW